METTALATITTTDQNTRRPIVWTIESAREQAYKGWTHSLLLTRPKGRSTYVMDVEMIGDVVVRHSSARKAW